VSINLSFTNAQEHSKAFILSGNHTPIDGHGDKRVMSPYSISALSAPPMTVSCHDLPLYATHVIRHSGKHGQRSCKLALHHSEPGKAPSPQPAQARWKRYLLQAAILSFLDSFHSANPFHQIFAKFMVSWSQVKFRMAIVKSVIIPHKLSCSIVLFRMQF